MSVRSWNSKTFPYLRALPHSRIQVNTLVQLGGALTIKKLIFSTSKDRTSVTLQNNSVIKFGKIGDLAGAKLPVGTHCKDSLDEWSKKNCLKAVCRGVCKLISNNASIEFYDESVDTINQSSFLYIISIISSARDFLWQIVSTKLVPQKTFRFYWGLILSYLACSKNIWILKYSCFLTNRRGFKLKK